MKIEIYKDNKKVKVSKKVTLTPYTPIELDFSSLNQLKGNNTILEYCFQNQKLESLDNG
jgi:hypothetical protein